MAGRIEVRAETLLKMLADMRGVALEAKHQRYMRSLRGEFEREKRGVEMCSDFRLCSVYS